MEFLERVACRFLAWRFLVDYGRECEEQDTEFFYPSGCCVCQAHFVRRFLKEHAEL